MAKTLIPGSKIQNTYGGKTYTGWVVKDCKDGTYLCRFKGFDGHNGNEEARNIGNPKTNDFWFVDPDWFPIKVLSYYDAKPGDYVRIKGKNYEIVSRCTDKTQVYIKWNKKTCYRGDAAVDAISKSVLEKGIKLVSLIYDVDAFFKSESAFGNKYKMTTEKKTELEIDNITDFHVGDRVKSYDGSTGEVAFIRGYEVLCKMDAPFVGHTAPTVWDHIGRQSEKCFWWYSDEHLKLISNGHEKIEITTNGKKTTAILYNHDGSIKRKAIAKCSPDDMFDFEIGAQIAMKRLKLNKVPAEDLVEKPKYSIVKCVGYTQKDEFFFTVGKEYKIYENGEITNDRGFTYGKPHGKDKKSMLRYLSDWYIFEEVK